MLLIDLVQTGIGMDVAWWYTIVHSTRALEQSPTLEAVIPMMGGPGKTVLVNSGTISLTFISVAAAIQLFYSWSV